MVLTLNYHWTELNQLTYGHRRTITLLSACEVFYEHLIHPDYCKDGTLRRKRSALTRGSHVMYIYLGNMSLHKQDSLKRMFRTNLQSEEFWHY